MIWRWFSVFPPIQSYIPNLYNRAYQTWAPQWERKEVLSPWHCFCCWLKVTFLWLFPYCRSVDNYQAHFGCPFLKYYYSKLHIRFRIINADLGYCTNILDTCSIVARSKFKALNICTASQNLRKKNWCFIEKYLGSQGWSLFHIYSPYSLLNF